MIKRNLSLSEKLNLIDKTFNIKKILKLSIDQKYINKYYWINQWAYSKFYSKNGFFHMGLSDKKVFKETDLVAPLNIISEYIKKNDSHSVLELACGRGANSAYLAHKYPEVNFIGLDISKSQIKQARYKSQQLNNFNCFQCDYHDLSQFEEKSFDLIFVIESLCYSQQKQLVFKAISRVLKRNSFFIVIDGYAGAIQKLNNDEKVGKKLTEIGMAVDSFDPYITFIKDAKSYGLKIYLEKNVSDQVIPSLKKLENLAYKFFRRKNYASIIKFFLPKSFTYNIVSGFLMPDLFKRGVFCYMVSIFKHK